MEKNKRPNRLIKEKSPYLLQHAYNPVDWYPWCSEAFQRAKEENKPIFLSIGYSTCHWCHVMAEESFEDPEIAKILNDYFISIKVDKEERPDIDNYYMTIAQALTNNVGWPLTIIMTPDKKPFFAAAYIPKTRTYNQIGLIELLPYIHQLWQENREKILQASDELIQIIDNLMQTQTAENIDYTIHNAAFNELEKRFDEKFGGFGTAPKFPAPNNLFYLARFYYYTKNQNALKIMTKTLRHMAWGGIFDQLGAGFHRYSTDQYWILPHFEKMLYDQALLIIAYAQTYQITKDGLFIKIAQKTADFALREMYTTDGGFCSALDADTKDGEGSYYLWTARELKNLIPESDFKIFSQVYNINEQGNCAIPGMNILYSGNSMEYYARSLKMEPAELEKNIERINRVLYKHRQKREPPARDKKIMTSWNGLMISALAKLGKIISQAKYLDEAEKTANFIREKLFVNNSLYHYYLDGANIEGFLDDYAFFIRGLINLYEATFNKEYLNFATSLAALTIDKFWDSDDKGFYTVSATTESPRRIKEFHDGAIPSANAIMALNLIKLGTLENHTEFSELADQTIKANSKNIKSSPLPFLTMLSNIFLRKNISEVKIRGDKNQLTPVLNHLGKEFIPDTVFSYTPAPEENIQFHLCKNGACLAPIKNTAELLEKLHGTINYK